MHLFLSLLHSIHSYNFLLKFTCTGNYLSYIVFTLKTYMEGFIFSSIDLSFLSEKLLYFFKYHMKILQIYSGLLVIVECSLLSIHLFKQIKIYCKLKGKLKHFSFNSLESPIKIIGTTFLYFEINSIYP